MNTRIDFVKGHGTQNDFVVVPDPEGVLGDVLDPAVVRRLTDRHAGLGADGLIRVAPTSSSPEVAAQAADARWFMDYRNADGSLAEMCGNGVRVMADYLRTSGLAGGAVVRVATRGGVRTVHVEADGQYTVEMGRAVPLSGGPEDDSGRAPDAAGADVLVGLGDRTWPATAVWVPNPHAVVFVDDRQADDGQATGSAREAGDVAEALAGLGPLTGVSSLDPPSVFPDGANVEFVVGAGARHIALRVWERGVGETRSCGTGVCAAAWAAMRRSGESVTTEIVYIVDVPGGRLRVTRRPDGELLLTGPSELGVAGGFEL